MGFSGGSSREVETIFVYLLLFFPTSYCFSCLCEALLRLFSFLFILLPSFLNCFCCCGLLLLFVILVFVVVTVATHIIYIYMLIL